MFKNIYEIFQYIIDKLGYKFVVIKKNKVLKNLYDTVIPQASYSPWKTDKLFIKTYSLCKVHTLVDIYRCYELWQLIAEVSKLKGDVIEVGVWRGGTGGITGKKIAIENSKDVFYLCDTFEGVVKTGKNDTYYRGREHADSSQEEVELFFKKVLKIKNYKILKGVFPDETGRLIEKKQFKFCHIDVDTYQGAKDIYKWVWPKLVVGGIIIFDDYGFASTDGVMKMVNEERCKEDRVVIHNLNGHGIIIKTAI